MQFSASCQLIFALVFISCSGCSAARAPLSPSLSMVESLPDAGGSVSATSELDAPVVMLHFFASWCTLCGYEFPHLTALRQSVPSERLGIVAIAVDDKQEDVRKMLVSRPLPFAVVVDEGNDAKSAFAITDLPTTIFVSRDGSPVRVQDAKSGKPTSRFEGAYEWDRGAALTALEGALQKKAGE